jgi:hypothetical protein
VPSKPIISDLPLKNKLEFSEQYIYFTVWYPERLYTLFLVATTSFLPSQSYLRLKSHKKPTAYNHCLEYVPDFGSTTTRAADIKHHRVLQLEHFKMFSGIREISVHVKTWMTHFISRVLVKRWLWNQMYISSCHVPNPTILLHSDKAKSTGSYTLSLYR